MYTRVCTLYVLTGLPVSGSAVAPLPPVLSPRGHPSKSRRGSVVGVLEVLVTLDPTRDLSVAGRYLDVSDFVEVCGVPP